MTEHEHSQVHMTLAINKLVPSPTNPRKSFPEEKLQEMANSIAKVGLLQPIIARTARDGKHEIVAGETRWRAARLAGLTDVSVIVRELTDFEAMELQILENLHRNDLSPLEEAHGFKNLLSKSQEGIVGYTIDELADKIGKSRTYVYDSLKLTELPEDASKALASGELNRSTALLIARLDPTVQTSALEKLTLAVVDGQHLPYRQAKDLINTEVKVSELNRQIDAKIQELREAGHVVYDYRLEENKEWAPYSFGSDTQWTKEGYLTENSSIPTPDDYASYKVANLITEVSDYAAIFIVGGTWGKELAFFRAYPIKPLEKTLQEHIAAGKVPLKEKSQHEIESEIRRGVEARRTELSKRLISAVLARGDQQDLAVIFKLAIPEIIDYSLKLDLLAPLGIESREQLQEVILQSNDTVFLSQLTLCAWIANNTEAPWRVTDPSYKEDDDRQWSAIKSIASIYGIGNAAKPTKQPATPPAAAQAQEQVARENHDHLAPDDIGHLSEAEAALTPGAPAAHAQAVVPPDSDDISQLPPGFAKARLRAEAQKAKRDQKVSAKADLSQSAPVAAATAEINSSEVTA